MTDEQLILLGVGAWLALNGLVLAIMYVDYKREKARGRH